MALGYLDNSKLYAIASAIRAKTSKSATMTVDEMPDEIGSITAGAVVEPLNVTENGTYSASSGYAYNPVTVSVSGGGGLSVDDVAMRTYGSELNGNASYIAPYAFYQNKTVTSVSFPSASFISNYAFASCQSLEDVSLQNVGEIGNYALANCVKIYAADFPEVKSVRQNAFRACTLLRSVTMPKVETVDQAAFMSCTNLRSVSFPNATTIGSSAFQSCYSLSAVTLGSVETIWNSAFYLCSRLTSLNLASVSSVPALKASVFNATPIGGSSIYTGGYGSVFVPSSLYSSFLTAMNWSSIASRIVSVS